MPAHLRPSASIRGSARIGIAFHRRPSASIGASKHRAFTLVELLVVVAIIGLTLALVTVNLFPDDQTQAKREAQRVAALLEQARDDAWFGGRPTLATFAEGSLSIARVNRRRELEAIADRTVAFSPEVHVLLVSLANAPAQADAALPFVPDGLGVPFRVRVDAGTARRYIEGDAAGAIRVVERPGA
jgi:general secretion pathway protein H